MSKSAIEQIAVNEKNAGYEDGADYVLYKISKELEQQKGCEYCALCNKGEGLGNLGLTALKNKELLPFVSVRLVTEGINIKGMRVNFCPVCGKRLKEAAV